MSILFLQGNMRSATWAFIAHFLTYSILIDVSDAIPLSGKSIQDADPNEFPFLVSIQRISSGNSRFCLGTLISQKSVLTATHCLHGERVDDVYVLVGINAFGQGTHHKVKSWISYEEWANITEELELSDYDVGVMTLEQKVEGINVASLTPFRIKDLYGQKVQMVGWSQQLDRTQPVKLKTAILRVISNDDCEKKIEHAANQQFKLPEAQFCTLADPWVLGDCGDSGGPLLNKLNQVVAVYVGVCPVTLIKFHHPRDDVNRRIVNLHAHLHYYRHFIDDVKED